MAPRAAITPVILLLLFVLVTSIALTTLIHVHLGHRHASPHCRLALRAGASSTWARQPLASLPAWVTEPRQGQGPWRQGRQVGGREGAVRDTCGLRW